MTTFPIFVNIEGKEEKISVTKSRCTPRSEMHFILGFENRSLDACFSPLQLYSENEQLKWGADPFNIYFESAKAIKAYHEEWGFKLDEYFNIN